jgi:hypothetical protein
LGKFLEGLLGELTLYVRHAAWLSAHPKGQKEPTRSRLDHLKAEDEAGRLAVGLEHPPLYDGKHLVEYLWEIGPTSGDGPVTFSEIEAWVRLTGNILDGWEAPALRQLSSAYASEHYAASDPKRPPPFTRATPPSRETVSQRLLEAFERLERQDARR